jgi:hypothetical protein
VADGEEIQRSVEPNVWSTSKTEGQINICDQTSAESKSIWSRAEMCDEFGLYDRVTMQALYNDRRMWIAAYFKEVFCGTIQSTQRSESVNSMVKGGYLDNSKSVHEFAKRFLDALVHIYDNDAREK